MTQALQIRPTQVDTQVVRRNDFMPAMSIEQAIERRNMIVAFTKDLMKEGIDYGKIPGTDKPTLLKPGAEKLNTLFGLTPRPTIIEKIEDWTGDGHGGEPFFYYHYRIGLYRGDDLIAEADGSANSWEKKHRYRWVGEGEVPPHMDKAKLRYKDGAIREPEFGISKAETSGKYGKPASYWKQFKDAIASGTARRVEIPKRDGGKMMGWEIGSKLYRISNEDSADLVNTLQKMSQKRALVASSLLATNASEFFTQDLEDMDMIDGTYTSEQVKPVMSVNPDDADFEFRSQWVGAIESRGGFEEQADKMLAGLLKQAGKSLASLDGQARVNLIRKANAGDFDKYLHKPQAPKEPDPVVEEDHGQFDEAEPAGVPDRAEQHVDAPTPPTPREAFIIQVHEAANEAGITDAVKINGAIQAWAIKVGKKGKEHEATQEQKDALFEAMKEKRGVFSFAP